MIEYIDSNIQWLGKIPSDWSLKKIKYTLRERVEKNNPIRTTDILSLTAKQGVIPYELKEGGGNKPKDDVSAYRLAYPGDIVMNSMNILSGSVGLSAYFGCVSPVYYMLRPYEKEHDVRFYNYIFQTTAFQRSLFGLGNGIMIKESGNGKLNTIRMRIPMDKFGGLYIPIAPAALQKRISDYLDQKCLEIENAKSAIQKELDVLAQYRSSVVSSAVTKGLKGVSLKASGIDWVSQVPDNWEVIPSKYLFHEVNIAKYPDDERLTSSVKYGIITQEEYMERENASLVVATKEVDRWKHVKPNDFVISLMSFKSGLEISNTTGCITWHYIVLEASKPICHDFYKWLFKSDAYILALRRTCNFIRNGQDLRFSNFAKVPLLVPPIQEQKEIAAYLDGKCKEIDAAIAAKEEQLEVLENYKKSLIYEYITGKKEVPSA